MRARHEAAVDARAHRGNKKLFFIFFINIFFLFSVVPSELKKYFLKKIFLKKIFIFTTPR